MQSQSILRAHSSRFFSMLVAALVVVALVAGCKEETTTPDPTTEIITTVTVKLTGDGVSTEYVWEDLDGTGANPPSRIDTMKVRLGASYSGTIKLENKSVTPTVDMTASVQAEKNQHRFFFTITGGIATVVANDMDDNSKPIGFKFLLIPAGKNTGTLTIALSHYESADAKTAVPSTETDVSVTYPITVE